MTRYLFCDDINDKHSDESREHWAESVFLTGEASELLSDDLKSAEAKLDKIRKRRELPDYLPEISKYALFVGIIIALAVIYEIASKGSTVAEVYQGKPWFFWVGCAAFIISGAAFLLNKSFDRKPSDSRKKQAAIQKVGDVGQKVAEYLDVPEDALKADILQFTYESKDEQLKILLMAQLKEMELFARDGDLCVFDGIDVYTLPKEEMKGIRVIDKEILVENWNKPEPQDDERFRKYGVKPNLGLKYCCALEIVREGEKYRLIFPAYELPAVQKLTCLEAPKLPAEGGKKKGKK